MKIDTSTLLDFWFEDSIETSEAYEHRSGVWFANTDPNFDSEVKKRFESFIEPVFAGEASQYEESPRGILALIIILDQFPRNIYRGTPRAFQYDSEALRLSLKAIDREDFRSLSYVERLFMFMPLQHVEDMELQNYSVKMFGTLSDVVKDDPVLCQAAQNSLEYAILHRDIIQDYGRFPHRNAILNRTSTQEEIDYLNSGAENFGQTVDAAQNDTQ